MAPGAARLGNADLLRLRMHALGLTHTISGASHGSTGHERIVAVVDHLGALQGQDWRASQWAIGVRAPGTTTSDIAAAFNARELVRSWPMRGTVHVTRAQDIGWIQELTGRRVVAGAPKRREFLGITDALLERLVSVSLEALTDGTSLNREQLSTIWSDAGIEWKSNWRYHLIWWMCQNNLTTFGPVEWPPTDAQVVPEPRLVRVDEWITHPRILEGDEALAELARAYVRGRGAVRQKDLAWWSGLTMGDAKRGLELAAELGHVTHAQITGVEGANGAVWADPSVLDTPAPLDNGSGAQLLPGFDEHLLGFTNREAQLDPQHFERVVPGRNGVFLPTVVQRGRTVGTWRRTPQTARDRTVAQGALEITAFPGERIDLAACAESATRWAAFYEVDVPAVRT